MSLSLQMPTTVRSEAQSADEPVFDTAHVEYLSSAGLRMILNTDELMDDKGGIRLIDIGRDVRSVLVMTKFSDLLRIK